MKMSVLCIINVINFDQCCKTIKLIGGEYVLKPIWTENEWITDTLFYWGEGLS